MKKKEAQGNYRKVSLSSIHGKVMEQLVLENTSRYIIKRKITRSSQHGFTQGESYLTNLINFYNDIAGLTDVRKAASA